jgi:SAM-dependent methyltransferase
MSHGRLIHHNHTAAAELSHVAAGDLGAELLRRLTAPAEHGSRKELERHLQLLSQLHAATGDLMDVPQNRASVALAGQQFRFVNHCWRKHGVPIAGAMHVDVGCGSVNPLARLFTHMMLGARRIVGIDLDLPASLQPTARNLARLAAAALLDPSRIYGNYPISRREVLANLDGFDLARLQQGDPAGLDAARAALLQRPIEDTGLGAGEVDVVVSNSVFEHLPDLDATLAEFARITRRGGFGIHGIDTIDHRWYGEPHLHPLEFLTIDSADPIVFGCNRVRLVEFPEIFRRHGFEVVEHWVHRGTAVTPDLRARLREPWRSMTDEALELTWADVLLRRM